MSRRAQGVETFERLRNWERGQTASEKLSAQFLIYNKYININPSHPRGGPDGGKDIICYKGRKKMIVACFFPKSKRPFSEIKNKFINDSQGISKNNGDGFIFITNQELTISQRSKLKKEIDNKYEIKIYHLENLRDFLDAPIGYGVRLEYLNIDMTKEEQISYLETKNTEIRELHTHIRKLLEEKIQNANGNISEVVTPEYTQDNLNLAFGYGRQYHKCSYCNYGFYVSNPAYYNSVITSGDKFVRCPKCGNLDKIF
ncbi:MAG: hypothetical protein LKI53_09540 [Bacteroidales bacterium]|jgi:hypothetical protein|nr:hypothetical protein [Bacteroidales bacterium]